MLRIQKTIDHFIARATVPMVTPNDSVATAATTMKAQRSDCVVVLDGAALVGIFTERDFLTRVAAQGRDPADTPVREVMTPKPDTLRSIDFISYAINRMGGKGYRHVPIVDLHAFSARFVPAGFIDHVHFAEDVREKQAAFLAGALAMWRAQRGR